MHSIEENANPVAVTSRKTGLLTFVASDRDRAKKQLEECQRGTERICRELTKDGSILLATAVDLFCKECPDISPEDAAKVIKRTFYNFL